MAADEKKIDPYRQSVIDAFDIYQDELFRRRRAMKIMAVALIAGVIANLSLLGSNYSWKRLSTKQQEQNESLFVQLQNAEIHVQSLTADNERLSSHNEALRRGFLVAVGWYRVLELLGIDPFPTFVTNSWGSKWGTGKP